MNKIIFMSYLNFKLYNVLRKGAGNGVGGRGSTRKGRYTVIHYTLLQVVYYTQEGMAREKGERE